jgi:excisionase family DNA binding protein
MRTTNRKDVLTTGQVAKICHVAPRTVSKWFDTGKLRGYRIPGSRDRRIPVDQLVAFMRSHGIPLDSLDNGICRILIMDTEVPGELIGAIENLDSYELRTAENGFEAGVVAQQFHPHVIVISVQEGEAEAAAICQNVKIHAELQSAKVLAAVPELDVNTSEDLLGRGFDGCLAKPYSLRELLEAVEDTTSLVR